MIVDNTIWKYEPEKQIIIFISQTGHGKPMVAAHEYVNPKGAAALKEAVAENNSIGRVITPHREYISFVIYKKHYNTRDKVDDILAAFKAVREKFPTKTLKISMGNPKIFDVLVEEPNVEFYSRWEGPLTKKPFG